MATVAFVVHPGHVEALALASDATCWLREAGHEVRLPEGFPDTGRPDTGRPDTGRPDTGRPDPGVPDTGGAGPEGADLVVSLGGDGTMLRAVALVHGSGTPVLGVNLGHLGYLTKVEPAGLRGALARFLAGDYVLDERMALDVSVDEGTSTREVSQMAFNDVVVEKRDSGHAVSLALSIGGRPFITYVADGLIVATPTGSTAYNLSSRGPIASPQLRAMIVTPVSPHMLFDRSLVLDPGEEVRVQVVEPRSAALIVDGAMMEELKPGTAVVCRSSPRPVRLVSVREHDFHTILRAKFGLPNRTEY